MKPGLGRYQAATKVKVLSPEILIVEEADSVHELEGSIVYIATVRSRLFLRGLSPWHDTARRHQELGRPYKLLRHVERRKNLLLAAVNKQSRRCQEVGSNNCRRRNSEGL